MKTTMLQPAAVQSAGAAAKSGCWLALAAARKRLDVRVPNLQDDLPAPVETYRKTRQLVDAGYGSKPTA